MSGSTAAGTFTHVCTLTFSNLAIILETVDSLSALPSQLAVLFSKITYFVVAFLSFDRIYFIFIVHTYSFSDTYIFQQ